MNNSKIITPGRSLGGSLLLAATLAFTPGARAGFAPFPLTEDFESVLNTNYWTLPAPWGPSWEVAHGGVSCLTDSPWTVYPASADVSARLGVDLRFAVRPVLTFWQRNAFEPNQDYGFVEVSRDQGASWSRLSAVTGLGDAAWTQVQVDLGDYAGAQTLIRFRLKSDGGTQYDGWYIDDLQVRENTGPKRFPFSDAMDTAQSASNWLASVWRQVPGGATGTSGQSWRCQLGNNYQPSGDLTCPLTLAGSVNLAATVNPKLSFWWRAGTQHANILYLQVSPDGGKNWVTLWSWDSNSSKSMAWTRQQVDLNSYVGSTNLAVRFLAYNRPPGYNFNLDFQVDDLLVDEAPADLGVTIGPGDDSRRSALLNWTVSSATDFAYYAIYRSTSSGVDPTDTLVTTISNRTTLSFQDTSLPVINQTYYYRVLVYDTQGLHNWGTNDVSYRTTWGRMVASLPFSDSFESGDTYWAADWPWGLTTDLAHTGTHCLTDSPGADYAGNTDASAYLWVNFGGATRPMLSFWQLFGLQPNQDFGFVEVSLDNGASWTRWYGVTSQSGANWQQVQVDLGSYAGTQALIRFRLRSDSSNPYDGWYLDDVELKDFGAGSVGFLFSDNMDTTASPSNWVASAWNQVPGSATSSSGQSWRCLIGNNYQPGGDFNSCLTLAGTVNLMGTVNPKLWFWWRAGAQHANILYAQVSTDGGKNWVSLWAWDSNSSKSMPWTRQQLDLNAYIGYTNLALRFLAYNRPPGYNFNLDFQVDDVQFGEQPAPPPELTATVAPGTDPRHNALLSWPASSASAFAYYAIYRSTSPGLSVGSPLVAAISNQSTLSFQDTGLDVCGQTYYYRLIVWDTNGLHNTGAPELAYRTSWGSLVTNLPFADGLEAGDGAWALDRPWEAIKGAGHTGVRGLTDSPGTNYGNSVDASAVLNLNLSEATRPMLSFWQRYGLEPNQDFGFVEVSTDGGASWTRWYAVTGQSGTNWSKVQVDLGSYAGRQALIRFRLKTDGQNAYDGWSIDDVEIKDFGLLSKGYPFSDAMDLGASQSNWVGSVWQQVPGSATSDSGQSWRCQIGNNYQPGSDLNCPLALAGTLNLATAVNPKLSFWWRAGAQHANILYAQVSTDGGKNWVTLWSWDSNSSRSMAWTRQQVDLNGYIGFTNLALRFYAYNRPPGYNFNLDFQVDEVLVDEAPADVGVTIGPGSDPTHSAQLSWTASTATDFACYAIYRSTSAGIDPGDTLLTTITNQATVSFQDPNLDLIGQTYYYRVLVYDNQGLHNWGTSDLSYKTSWAQLVATLPFSDSFENGEAYWAVDRPWNLTTELARTGTHCLTDSPGTDYANNADLSAYLRVNLGGATRPMLSFWQLYGLQPNQDFGFVEISLDNGANWTRWYGVTSQSGAGWQHVQVDLGGYAGTQVVIRFRLRSDGSSPYDGWYLDDVEIKDFGGVAFGYPFFDNMDTTLSPSNWAASAWSQVPGSATSGSGQSWRCLLGNNYQPGGDFNSCLTLAGTVNLAAAVNPQLWFWWRAGAQHANILYAQVSTDGGKNWVSLWGWDSNSSKSMPWTRQQVDLNAYLGYTNLALRFLAYNRPPGYNFNLDFQIDDVLIAEGGGCPAILTMSPMPTALLGYPYNLILQTTNGSPPHLWALVSNSLPPGLVLDPVNGILSGTPTNTGTYSFRLGVTASNSCSQYKQFSLTVQEYLPLFPTHSAQAFVSPGTNIVYCQVDNQTGHRLWSLAWVPTLPAGWTILSASGDGSPEVGPDGRILFQAANLSNSPLRFSYSVRVPAGQTQARPIGGAAVALLENLVLERTVAAQPDPLFTQPRLYHSADCSTNWSLETTEANRVLAYWRALAYQLDPTSCDGYAPGTGTLLGALHSADYRAPYWAIDGTELNRVLAYWRAGCYHQDAAGVDGYAAGCTNPPATPKSAKSSDQPVITQQAPPGYTPGGTLLVTNTLHYSGSMLSLLWRPRLPAGWSLLEVFADGAPETLGGEIVWTASRLPPSPVTVLYRVQVPAGDQGARQIHSEVEYQTPAMVNAVVAPASPDPLTVTSPSVRFTALTRLPDGRVQLGLLGALDTPVRIQFTPTLPAATWETLTNLPSLNGSLQFIDGTAPNAPQRFYRTVAP